jgi:brefeldin A-resistance guanine nucleotide exchange factor 1
LKNILLVMADSGYLAPPTQDPSKEKIWTETRRRLERSLPGLFAEIFPDVPLSPPRDNNKPMQQEEASNGHSHDDDTNDDTNTNTTEKESHAGAAVATTSPDEVD